MSKPGILTWVENNWETIECNFYSSLYNQAGWASAKSIYTGQFWAAGGLAVAGLALYKTAEYRGCYYKEPEPDGENLLAGCQKIGEGDGTLYYNRTDSESPGAAVAYNVAEITKIDEKYLNGQGKWAWEVFYKTSPRQDGTVFEGSYYYIKENTRFPVATLTPNEGAVCEVQAPDNQPDPHTPGDPICEPYEHEEDGCNWTIQATDAYIDDQGMVHTYYTITADNDACGGPFAYWSSDDGPHYVHPDPPIPDPPDPVPPNPPDDWQPQFDEINDKLDDIQEQLDEIQNCACPEKPELARHWRSIRFESDEQTPRGNRRLSKLFRYRGVSPGVVTTVADHWKDFRWTTGPACVFHEGSALGNPQVWAATVDEGQRVIRHAGREAGIDPDQVGEWRVGGSDNPRYGVSLEVGLFRVDGCWSATSRPGPDGWPEASVVFPDP